MQMINLRLRFVVGVACCALSVASPRSIAQQSNPTNAPVVLDASEMARNVMTTAELSIKASERTLSVMMWLLGLCLGGSTLGVAGLWLWLSTFRRKMRAEVSQSHSNIDSLLRSAGKTAATFEQVMCSLPMLFVDGIDESNKVVALNTLAQLQRPELAPIFEALLKNAKSTRIQAAAVYALGLLEANATNSVNEILQLSVNADFNLRRECARALIAIAPASREVRTRLEEMAKDADDIVKDLARDGLKKAC